MGLHETLDRERQWVYMRQWIERGSGQWIEMQWVYMSHWIERETEGLRETVNRERQWVYVRHWIERGSGFTRVTG